MAATTLTRDCRHMGIRGHAICKVAAIGTIAAGNTVTVTHPTSGKSVVGTVERLLPNGQFAMLITAVPVYSGGLYMPKGSSVA